MTDQLFPGENTSPGLNSESTKGTSSDLQSHFNEKISASHDEIHSIHHLLQSGGQCSLDQLETLYKSGQEEDILEHLSQFRNLDSTAFAYRLIQDKKLYLVSYHRNAFPAQLDLSEEIIKEYIEHGEGDQLIGLEQKFTMHYNDAEIADLIIESRNLHGIAGLVAIYDEFVSPKLALDHEKVLSRIIELGYGEMVVNQLLSTLGLSDWNPERYKPQ